MSAINPNSRNSSPPVMPPTTPEKARTKTASSTCDEFGDVLESSPPPNPKTPDRHFTIGPPHERPSKGIRMVVDGIVSVRKGKEHSLFSDPLQRYKNAKGKPLNGLIQFQYGCQNPITSDQYITIPKSKDFGGYGSAVIRMLCLEVALNDKVNADFKITDPISFQEWCINEVYSTPEVLQSFFHEFTNIKVCRYQLAVREIRIDDDESINTIIKLLNDSDFSIIVSSGRPNGKTQLMMLDKMISEEGHETFLFRDPTDGRAYRVTRETIIELSRNLDDDPQYCLYLEKI
ncbi:MAG: hypothetical protein KR126chlam1_00366 [Chlamydiae bacterium]|nr:hypothetical protein [Chlamydiota bacterium]